MQMEVFARNYVNQEYPVTRQYRKDVILEQFQSAIIAMILEQYFQIIDKTAKLLPLPIVTSDIKYGTIVDINSSC